MTIDESKWSSRQEYWSYRQAGTVTTAEFTAAAATLALIMDIACLRFTTFPPPPHLKDKDFPKLILQIEKRLSNVRSMVQKLHEAGPF